MRADREVFALDGMSAAGGFLLFATVGGLYALYGPVIPTLRESFDIGAGAAGLALTAHFAGAMAGIVGWAVAEPRVGSRSALRASTTLVIAGSAGFALAPAWSLALGAAAVIGVGFGALVVGLNTLFARGFGRRSAAMLNLLGASFGFGAITGPIAVALAGGRFGPPFLGGAALAAACLPLVLKAPSLPRTERLEGGSGALVPRRLWGFMVFYALYVGVESGIGGWEATHLHSGGASEAAAANWTAAYWGAITIGRLLAVPVAVRFAPPRVVLGALSLTIAMLGIAHITPLAPVAYAAAGLMLAPIFPTGLAWLTASLPAARGATAMVIGSAQLGGVIAPPVIGRLVGVASAAIIPTSVLVVAVACLVAALLLGRRDRMAARPVGA